MPRKIHLDSRPDRDRTITAERPRGERPRGERRRRGRDLAAWMALGLGVAIALVLTTRHAGEAAAHPSASHIGRTTSTSTTILLLPRAGHETGSMGIDLSDSAPTTSSTTLVTTSTLITATTSSPVGTSTSTPSPTTTPSVPQLATTSFHGRLTYPDDVATTYLLTTTGGPVAVSAAWTGTNELSVTLACRGRTRSERATLDLSMRVVADPGTCRVTLAELAGSTSSATYTLNVSDDTIAPSGQG